MTAITATPRAPARPRPARARDVLASEWIKLRSVRSTYLTLLFAAAAAVGVGYLVTHADATHWATMSASPRPLKLSPTGSKADLALALMVAQWVASAWVTRYPTPAAAAAANSRVR